MIDLYTWKTANCQKVNIALCELDLPYRVHGIDISRGDQKEPAHMARNPNGKVPVIVDNDVGLSLFESGAILLYLAEKSQRLMPADTIDRWRATQWVFWQMAGLGPAGAQVIHFGGDPERGQYALQRFKTELERLFSVLDGVLAGRDFIVGDYSMADIAIWPWVSRFRRFDIDLGHYSEIRRWYLSLADRPGVIKGVKLLQPDAEIPRP